MRWTWYLKINSKVSKNHEIIWVPLKKVPIPDNRRIVIWSLVISMPRSKSQWDRQTGGRSKTFFFNEEGALDIINTGHQNKINPCANKTGHETWTWRKECGWIINFGLDDSNNIQKKNYCWVSFSTLSGLALQNFKTNMF